MYVKCYWHFNSWLLSDLLFEKEVSKIVLLKLSLTASGNQVIIAQWLAWRLANGEVLGSNPSKGDNYYFWIKRKYLFEFEFMTWYIQFITRYIYQLWYYIIYLFTRLTPRQHLHHSIKHLFSLYFQEKTITIWTLTQFFLVA